MKKQYKTPQEDFWAGDFGNNYINRNKGKYLLASNLNFFNKALKSVANPTSFIEFGANIGMNLKAIQLLFPDAITKGIEINQEASKILSGPAPKFEGDKKAFIEDLKNALYASKIVSYAQGYALMSEAAKEFGWELNYGGYDDSKTYMRQSPREKERQKAQQKDKGIFE